MVYSPVSFAEAVPTKERRGTHYDPMSPTPALVVGYRAPNPITELDEYAAYYLLVQVLAEGESARLYKRLVKTGLVTVGSHSHRHADGRGLAPEALAEEAAASREILFARLGPSAAAAYAYPYGSSRLGHLSPAYRAAVQSAGYAMAFSTDLGLADGDSDFYALPRIEAHPLDTAAVLRAKVLGVLGPYRITDRLRKANRAA